MLICVMFFEYSFIVPSRVYVPRPNTRIAVYLKLIIAYIRGNVYVVSI